MLQLDDSGLKHDKNSELSQINEEIEKENEDELKNMIIVIQWIEMMNIKILKKQIIL